MRILTAASLLVAFAGLSGGCNKSSQDDPSQDKAFADQLANASSSGKSRPTMPGKAEGAAKLKEALSGVKSAAKPEAPGSKPSDAKVDAMAKKPEATDSKAPASGN